jgi:hypothetical protein
LATVLKSPPRHALTGGHLSRHDLAALRHALLAQHRAHREQLSRTGSGRTAPRCDVGADPAVRGLRRVARALAYMDMGIYGVCLSCGTEIPLARLAAVPTARRCAPCERRRSGEEA